MAVFEVAAAIAGASAAPGGIGLTLVVYRMPFGSRGWDTVRNKLGSDPNDRHANLGLGAVVLSLLVIGVAIAAIATDSWPATWVAAVLLAASAIVGVIGLVVRYRY